jgi:iron complex outermembrane receptor protein
LPFFPFTQIGHFSAFTWTLAADYAIDDETKAYVTGRRGYKSGGFNSGGFNAGFEPEFLTDIEIGVKHAGTILGIPASLNADAYYGWYSNIQKNDFAFEGVIPIVVTFNAAKAHISGFELSTVLKPAELVDLSFFYAYTDASYDSFDTLFTGEHKHDPFVFTPRNKLGATGRLWLPVDPAWGKPAFAATVYYQSRVWFSDFADLEPDSSQGGYALVNLRLDWNSICGSNLDAAVFVDNVGDQLYKVGANPLEHLTLTTSSMFGPPRMWGLELRYHVGG